MSRLSDAAWWYWLATVVLLTGWLSGCATCFYLVVALCAIQAAHFAWRRRSMAAFPVQVRLAYLALLVVGLWPPLHVVHWIQLIGTSAVVVTDYCFLARVLSLLPWNRTERLGVGLLRRTFLTPPVRGSFVQKSTVAEPCLEAQCSLKRSRNTFHNVSTECDGLATGAGPTSL